MVIWSGHGYVAAVAVFVTSLLMEIVTENVVGDDQFYQESTWAFPLALLMSSVIIFVLHQGFFANTGSKDSLFFIPLKWCAPVVAVLAVVAFVAR